VSEATPGARPVGHDDHVSLQAAFGGKAGMLDAGLPGVLFILSYALAGRNLQLALIIALASAALLSILRLFQRKSLQHALSGFIGVGIAAFIASRTGRAEDFYVPSLFRNAAFALVFAISILVRWPIIGVLLALITQSGMSWRQDPVLVRAYSRASWVWAGMFALRLAVLLPLWLLGDVVALGTAGVALGLPLYLVVLWITYRVLKASVPVGTSVMPPKPLESEEPADRNAVPGG
jgi:Protein of unknown function (DUF3159)